jgi:hypothetical protein
MLSSAYLSRKLTSPIPTKDGGTLRTIEETCEYMAAIGKDPTINIGQQLRAVRDRVALPVLAGTIILEAVDDLGTILP